MTKDWTPAHLHNLQRSKRSGRLICNCKKGYACEDESSKRYGRCFDCFRASLSAKQRRNYRWR